MKTSELTRLLKKKGCRLLEHGTRHDRWINPQTGKTTEVPRHKSQEIATGTVKVIMKKLGL